jgi:hypothetical protein
MMAKKKKWVKKKTKMMIAMNMQTHHAVMKA